MPNIINQNEIKMKWDELSMAQKSELMQLYIRNGVTSLDDMRSHFNSFATGGSTNPDWDPDNPYHYHTTSGEKVVITPEDWKRHKGQPYFKQVEDAVLAEQAAYPGPEYIINPQFSEDLRRVYKGNMGPKYQNYSNFSGNLPQGYNFTPEGLVQDNQGNLYVQKGFRQTPRFTYNESNPLVFPVREGRNRGNVVFYPVNMEKTLKPSLPVSKIMDVESERNKQIENYLNKDITDIEYTSPYYLGHSIKMKTSNSSDGFKDIYFIRSVWDDAIRYQEFDSKDEAIEFAKNLPKLKNYVDWSNSIRDFMNEEEYYPSVQIKKQIKPSRKEAGKKAVIEIGPLQVDKIETFGNGGYLFATGGPKKTYKEWITQMQTKYPWLELDPNKAGYDYERYFNENYDDAIARLNEAEARHFTDRYKLPNHLTYSDESIYSEEPRIGGSWTRDGRFIPSVTNMQQHPNIYREPRPYTEDEIYGRKKQISEPVNLQTMFENNPTYGQNKHIDTTMLRDLDNLLIQREMPLPQRQSIIFSSQQEGNTTGAHGNGAYGLVGWRGERATPIIDKSLEEQAEYLYNTLMNYDPSHWNHGGKGSGYQTGREAQEAFMNAQTAEDAIRALNYGYIRPPQADRTFRVNNVNNIFGIQ